MYLEEVYLFTGTEQVIKKNKMDRILSNLDPKETDIITYDAEITTIQEIVADCMTIPFLKAQKVIVIKNPIFLTNAKTNVKHDNKLLIKYLQNPSDTTILLIDAVGLNIDKNAEIYKVLQKSAYIIDIKELDEVECRAWVKRRLETEGTTIGEEALNLLIEYLHGDLLRMEQEVAKLASFRYHDRVTEEDIKNLVSRNYDEDLYKLVKAIINKDRNQIISLYQGITQSVTDVGSLMALITKSFIDLYTTAKLIESGYSQQDIANVFGIKTGRAYYMMKDAQSLRLDTLEEYVNLILKLDYQIKNGLIDKAFGLEMLLLSLK
ncbi:MAG: DNA polymerase III subunit delta [Bacilli bacterium]|nr:DNA polymerase III subunit delta [Bacilli bacterium]